MARIDCGASNQVAAAESVLSSRSALTAVVADQVFDNKKTGAKELKSLIFDVDDVFWPLLQSWVDFMQPLRLAIHSA